MKHELAILGAGQMAEAILRGLLRGGVIPPAKIIASDPTEARRQLFASLGVAVTDSNAEAVANADIILLACKPYQVADVLSPLRQLISHHTLVISIAAGISTQTIGDALGSQNRRIVRAMPNTPMLIGAGAVGIAPNAAATPQDIATARKIFESAALVVEVTEKQIDAVTALSGSGPAYFFLLVECMIQAAVEMGLDPQMARSLAIQTCFGAGKLLAESSDAPEELRRKVTTPNGTTHAAISSMESADFRGIINRALKAAQARAIELGQNSRK
jgi:pyrroline-5-carboxylate reductase